jgi:lactoylglutathione lyase
MNDKQAVQKTSLDIVGAFEVHIPVSNLEASIQFYRDLLGLQLAQVSEDRGYAFFWLGPQGSQMLGLWANDCPDPPVSPGPSHFAMRVAGDDIEGSFRKLKEAGITPLDFEGNPSSEPEVICWMPAAAVYFRDPDGHLLEFIAMLTERPRPELGVVVTLSKWERERLRTSD